MAFMDHNRAINSGMASADAAEQRAQRTLSTNDMNLGTPQSRTFEPDLMTLEAINSRHKGASVDGSDSGPSYNQHLPYGPLMGAGESPLR